MRIFLKKTVFSPSNYHYWADWPYNGCRLRTRNLTFKGPRPVEPTERSYREKAVAFGLLLLRSMVVVGKT